MIRNVVFDIGNVLAGFDWENYYAGFGYEQEILDRLARATVKSPLWNELDRGKMSEDELLAGFIKNDPGIEKEIRAVMENVEHMILRYDYAIPWIREVKERGLGAYVISNFARKAHHDCIRALDFLGEMDGVILSYQVELIKPNPEIYRLLCRNYGLAAKECVFIDDTPVNVEAAKKEGMKGICFHTLEQTKKELKEILDGSRRM